MLQGTPTHMTMCAQQFAALRWDHALPNGSTITINDQIPYGTIKFGVKP